MSCMPGRPAIRGRSPCCATRRAIRGWSCNSGKDQLPAFTLWKNTGGLRDGYVTGPRAGDELPERPAV